MPSGFLKQTQFVLGAGGKFNAGTGDTTIGGQLTAAPALSGTPLSQQDQTLPGDRIILGSADALALSNTTVGTLYGGLYQYVTFKSTATAAFTRTRLCFWDTTVADSVFQVTSDESGTTGVSLIAGVMIITATAGNSWWVQAFGKATIAFRGTLTGTATIGQAVYAAGAGAGTDVGTADVFTGVGTTLTYSLLGQAQVRYLGVAEVLPVAGSSTLVDMPMQRPYRW